MVLTKSELIALLQNEVRILLHLASKIDRAKLDYRPTPKQRSTIELLRYLSVMGPGFVRAAKGEIDAAARTAATEAAEARDFDQTLSAIAAHAETYATLLADVSDADLRAEVVGMDGNKTTRGALLVSLALCGCAAYRTQLFLYLKACGREDLTTMNLWAGFDRPATV